METNINEIATALAKVKFGPIKKTKSVRVQTRTGGSYTFDYSPLEEIMGAIRQPLADQGLTLTQSINPEATQCLTTLMHSSGQSMVSSVPMTQPVAYDSKGERRQPTNQEWGSAISYSRRYGITLILALSPDDDDDANIADGNTVLPAVTGVAAKVSKVTPLDGAGDELSEERKASVRSYANLISNSHAAGNLVQVMSLYREVEDMEEINYLFLKLDSKVRAAIKKQESEERRNQAREFQSVEKTDRESTMAAIEKKFE